MGACVPVGDLLEGAFIRGRCPGLSCLFVCSSNVVCA